MGYRDPCCYCPDAWENFINRWVYVYLVNDEDPLYETEWQLRQVQDRYIVIRRPVVDLGGWQHAAIPCQHIVALVEAPPQNSTLV